MTQVIPPRAISRIRPSQEFSRAQDNYLDYLELIINQIYERSGGTEDLIESADESIDFNAMAALLNQDSEEVSNSYPIKNLEDRTLLAGSTTLTTIGDEFITCLNTAAAVITLNLTPDDGEDAVVWRAAGPVRVNGSINGQSSITIANKYDTPHFKYSLAAGMWAIV